MLLTLQGTSNFQMLTNFCKQPLSIQDTTCNYIVKLVGTSQHMLTCWHSTANRFQTTFLDRCIQFVFGRKVQVAQKTMDRVIKKGMMKFFLPHIGIGFLVSVGRYVYTKLSQRTKNTGAANSFRLLGPHLLPPTLF